MTNLELEFKLKDLPHLILPLEVITKDFQFYPRGKEGKIEVKYGEYKYKLYPFSLLKHEPSLTTCLEKSKKIQDEFKKIHGETYNYDKVIYTHGNKKVIITCKLHGDFQQSSNAHKQGQGCLECAKDEVRMKVSDYLKEAKKVHKNKYSYTLGGDFIKNKKNKITIICPLHGETSQPADVHLNGQGCNKCKYLLNNKRFEDWCKYRPNNPGIFYIIKCEDEEETFYKLGITTKDNVKQRYGKGKNSIMPYNYTIISTEKNFDKKVIWEQEIQMKKLNAKNSYIPKKSFNGSKTECYTKIELI